MTQNISSAVMQQRAEPHNSLDDFPTPPWATRALCEFIGESFGPMDRKTCREPAANRGHMVKPLEEYFGCVLAGDVHDYGAGFPVEDYLFGGLPNKTDWTITNPPFRLAEQFIDRALQVSNGVAVIVRSAFLEGGGQWQRLYRETPPQFVLQFSERVVMHKGKLTATGSTATAYCWLVWNRSVSQRHTIFDWFPPGTRKRFERETDYQEAAHSRASDHSAPDTPENTRAAHTGRSVAAGG